jgi:hypothetical protein
MAHLHPAIAMDRKGPLETHLGLASYIHGSQRGGSPQDIVEGTGPEGTPPEGAAALQRGHPAVQFLGDQGFQEHQDRPDPQDHLALQNRQVLLQAPAGGLDSSVY